MIKNNNNEVLIEKSFNISQKIGNLIDGFNFSTNPEDGIKDVKIKTLKVGSLSDAQNLTLEINNNKKTILDVIKANNISTNRLVIKEIGLDIKFYGGFSDKGKKSKFVRINYFDQNKTKNTNPVIDKYLESWGLVKARAI